MALPRTCRVPPSRRDTQPLCILFRSRLFPYWVVRIRCDNVPDDDRAVEQIGRERGFWSNHRLLVYKRFGALGLEPRHGACLISCVT